MKGLYKLKRYGIILAAFALLAGAIVAVRVPHAGAAACTVPATSYGTVSNLTANIKSTATYRVWSRMAAPNTTNHTYLLEVDGSTCYTVGSTTVPVYASGATSYFSSGSTNWVSKTSSGTQIDINLAAGTHTLKLIGNASGVVVDRIVMTQDTSCIPTGTGENCATPPDTTPPVVAITTPVNNATVSGTITVTAHATDDVLVSKVGFYVDGVLKGTDTTGSASDYTYSLNPATLGLGVGPHTLTAKAYDSSNNITTSSAVTINVVDTTPPLISAIATSGIAQTTATITWTTNEPADSQVEYARTTTYTNVTPLNSTKVTSHSVGLTGLTPNMLYHYRIKTKDASGNLRISADQTFTTLATAADTTVPTGTITSPVGGATVTGIITVSASASDNVGVAGVQFKLDGANIGVEDTTAPYSVSWDTKTATNGTHTLTALVRDAAGNTKTSAAVSVTVKNTVTVTYLSEDINQDTHVDLLDFSLLSAKFGQTGTTLGRADINSDNSVNLLDFSQLSSKFGTA